MSSFATELSSCVIPALATRSSRYDIFSCLHAYKVLHVLETSHVTWTCHRGAQIIGTISAYMNIGRGHHGTMGQRDTTRDRPCHPSRRFLEEGREKESDRVPSHPVPRSLHYMITPVYSYLNMVVTDRIFHKRFAFFFQLSRRACCTSVDLLSQTIRVEGLLWYTKRC